MQKIILKYDDLTEESLNDFEKVSLLLKRMDIRGAFGLIGSSLDKPSENYIRHIRDFEDNGIEIWNHGYEKAHSEHEFCGSSYEEQKKSIGKTQQLIKRYLGRTAVTFGSPHNNSTEITISVLKDHFPEIKNYLYMADAQKRTDAHQILLRCNYEVKTGVPDFDLFLNNYSRMKEYPYMMLQGHPGFWNDEGFENHQKIIDFLKEKKCTFIQPREYEKTNSNEKKDFLRKKETQQLQDYLDGFENIIFYGAGEIARELYRFLSELNRRPEAMAVSDDQRIVEKEVCGIKVGSFSEIIKDYEKRNTCIVPALLRTIHPFVLPIIKASGFSYWDCMNMVEYDRFIDYVRYKVGG